MVKNIKDIFSYHHDVRFLPICRHRWPQPFVMCRSCGQPYTNVNILSKISQGVSLRVDTHVLASKVSRITLIYCRLNEP